jgi:hypothetical protein
MIEHFEKRESEYLKKEEEWKLEIAKMKEFVQTNVIEMEQEREKSKRIFSFEGQQTFEKQRKEIATL